MSSEDFVEIVRRVGGDDAKARATLLKEFTTLSLTDGAEASTPEGMGSFIDRVSSESGVDKEQVMELIEKWCVSHI